MSEERRVLQRRINRIATDLAESTGRPLRFWLEETARMLARDATWMIRPDDDGIDELVLLDGPGEAAQP